MFLKYHLSSIPILYGEKTSAACPYAHIHAYRGFSGSWVRRSEQPYGMNFRSSLGESINSISVMVKVMIQQRRNKNQLVPSLFQSSFHEKSTKFHPGMQIFKILERWNKNIPKRLFEEEQREWETWIRLYARV